MVSPPKACSSPAKAPLCLPPWWGRRAWLPRLGEGALDKVGYVEPSSVLTALGLQRQPPHSQRLVLPRSTEGAQWGGHVGLCTLVSRLQFTGSPQGKELGSQNCYRSPYQPLGGWSSRWGLWGGLSESPSLIPSSPVNELQASKMRLLHHLMDWNSLRGRGDGTGSRGAWHPLPLPPSPSGLSIESPPVWRAHPEGSPHHESPGSCSVRRPGSEPAQPLHAGLPSGAWLPPQTLPKSPGLCTCCSRLCLPFPPWAPAAPELLLSCLFSVL